MKVFKAGAVLLALLLVLAGCTRTGAEPAKPQSKEVVLYTSVDQIYAEPILKAFEKETGIKVKAVYDIESSKTTGLVNRLEAEKDKPQCDVFWNNEFVQTMELDAKGVFEGYQSSQIGQRKDVFKESGANWIGFGGRCRVLLINTEKLSGRDKPTHLTDLLGPQWQGSEIAIAQPLFGTSFTHGAALFAAWGSDEAKGWYKAVKFKGVQVVDGNSVVRDMVADGRAVIGLTDTDDALGAVRNGAPVEMIFPDQAEGEKGTLVVPNTLSLVADAPHSKEGQALIDYLLGNAVQKELEAGGYFATSTESGVVKKMPVTYQEVYQNLETAKTFLTETFVK